MIVAYPYPKPVFPGKHIMIRTVFAAAAMLAATSASATLVATRDFDNPNFTLAGVTAVSSAGGGAATGVQSITGFGSRFFQNDTGGQWQIALSGLAAHTSATISVSLAFLDSWDSTDGNPAPDYLIWSIDGVDIASLTTNNASGSVVDFAGGTVLQSGNVWDGSGYSDRIVDMSTSTLANFSHSGSTLTFGLRFGGAGFQGGPDESWGFDNLRISINGDGAVPEPAT